MINGTVLSIDWRRSLGYFDKLIFIFASKQAHVVADDVVTSSDIAYTSHLLDGISCKIEHLLIKISQRSRRISFGRVTAAADDTFRNQCDPGW
jgi:hypothetical protein